jgi:hypothetical protein
MSDEHHQQQLSGVKRKNVHSLNPRRREKLKKRKADEASPELTTAEKQRRTEQRKRRVRGGTRAAAAVVVSVAAAALMLRLCPQHASPRAAPLAASITAHMPASHPTRHTPQQRQELAVRLRAEGRSYSSETFRAKKRKAAREAQGVFVKRKLSTAKKAARVKVKSTQRDKAPYNVRACVREDCCGAVARAPRHTPPPLVPGQQDPPPPPKKQPDPTRPIAPQHRATHARHNYRSSSCPSPGGSARRSLRASAQQQSWPSSC